MKLTYNPQVFEAPDLRAAKDIIVTPQADMDTDQRWEVETPYLAALFGNALDIRPGQLVLDYGCGVGRISKALIERFDCRVLGVDISTQMRGLAPAYVDSAAFSVVSRSVLQTLYERGLRADAAICVWVLQHCLTPADDIDLICRALSPGAPMAVVNNHGRAVPTLEHGWRSDGVDVRELLGSKLTMVTEDALDPEVVTSWVSERTFWGVYRR